MQVYDGLWCNFGAMSSTSGLWQIVRDSLRGGERDYTAMGLRRAVVLLSVPMVLEMAMESLFSLVDVFFVSRLGNDAVAVVGLTEGVMLLIYSLAWGLAAGITALVARRVGSKDREGAGKAAGQGLLIALLLGVVLAIPGLVHAQGLLRLMGGSAEVQELGAPFMAIMVGSNVVVLLLFAINAIFRGAGDPAVAMRTLWLANGVNLVLDPLLIFGLGPIPAMGVTGAAVATLIGRSCGVAYQSWYLFRGHRGVSIMARHFAVAWKAFWSIVRLSAAAAGQFFIASASWLFMVRIVAAFGSGEVAAYTIAVRIVVVFMLPAYGIANAASTLVGQNLGAGQPRRAERSAWMCGHINAVYMTAMTLFFLIAAPWLIGVFTQDPLVLAIGVQALRIISIGYFFYAYGIVLAQAFNGAGDAFTPLWLNLVCFWLVEIPLAWYLAMWLHSPVGVFIAITVAESLLALFSAVVFRQGKWKTVMV